MTKKKVEITKEEQQLLQQLSGAYSQKRTGEIVKLQSKLVEAIVEAKMPTQDVLMALTVIRKQLEDNYIGRLQLKPEQKEKER